MAKAKKAKPAPRKKMPVVKRPPAIPRGRPCTPAAVCKWIDQMAPFSVPNSPWPETSEPWLTQFYKKYCELYEAVRRLELHTYCNVPQTPFIVTCPGSGGGPDKTGSPPPPQFPPL